MDKDNNSGLTAAEAEALIRSKLPVEIHGRLRSARITDGRAVIVAEAGDLGAKARQELEGLIEQALLQLDQVNEVRVALIADRRRRMIIAVGSGKGGVGKSTLTTNLAVALAKMGRKVGVIDGDIYGPSQPRMLGVSGRPQSPDGKLILPLRNYGVTMMSIGLMTNDDQAVVWRGPMLMGALQQMLTQVQWGALDVLIVDLPPGTGDVQMTLAQKAQLDGAIIVSTPQDVALMDARKGIDMFNQMKTPIIGMIENMSTHICSSCGHEEHVFGHGGVAAEAEKLGLPLLAEIPLHLDIRLAADGGAPIVVSKPDSAQAQGFRSVAKALVAAGQA